MVEKWQYYCFHFISLIFLIFVYVWCVYCTRVCIHARGTHLPWFSCGGHIATMGWSSLSTLRQGLFVYFCICQARCSWASRDFNYWYLVNLYIFMDQASLLIALRIQPRLLDMLSMHFTAKLCPQSHTISFHYQKNYYIAHAVYEWSCMSQLCMKAANNSVALIFTPNLHMGSFKLPHRAWLSCLVLATPVLDYSNIVFV